MFTIIEIVKQPKLLGKIEMDNYNLFIRSLSHYSETSWDLTNNYKLLYIRVISSLDKSLIACYQG